MQDINNQLDELFQKAVSGYTLRESENRWDELASRLSATDAHRSAGMTETSQKISNPTLRHAVWILAAVVLLPFLLNNPTIPHPLKNVSLTTGKTEPAWVTGSLVKVPENHPDPGVNASSSPVHPSIFFRGDVSKRNPLHPLQNGERTTGSNTSFPAKAGENNPPPPPGSSGPGESQVASEKVSLKPVSLELPALRQSAANTGLQNLHSVRRRGLYMGILFGPMSSQVKNQGHNKPGIDAGMLIGYKISSRIAIETGLIFTKQYYYVGGKYYNEVSGSDQVQSLEGNRTAIEIPLKLNYAVLKTKTGNFYVSTGVSSFIGVRENIVLQVGDHVPPPSQRIDYGRASYLPSYWDFSLGYERRIGKIANLRIELYLQIPLKRGVENAINLNATGGALQVYNAGLHLEITRFIH